MTQFAHAAPYAADLARAFVRAPAAAPAFPAEGHGVPVRLRPSLADLLKRFHGTLSLARQRRDLARLSEHHLRDIGLDAEAAASEAARPVWDAPVGWR